MTNFEFVKSLGLDAFIKVLSLTTGCPFGRRNLVCNDMVSCHQCWKIWLNKDYDDGVPGGIV